MRLLLLAAAAVVCCCFTPVVRLRCPRSRVGVRLRQGKYGDNTKASAFPNTPPNTPPSDASRKDALAGLFAISLLDDAALAAFGLRSAVLGGAPGVADADVPAVTVIGANGRTGRACVAALAGAGRSVRAGTRINVLAYDVPDAVLSVEADVTKPDTLADVCAGATAVIFAASASKQGGGAAAVDNAGLVNVAKACIAAGVPRLVVVSSGGVSKPNSSVYKFLNVVGGNIMTEKIRGEDALRALYADAPKAVGYTVVRPGGLTDEAPRGVGAVEVSQGDEYSGRISRADLADLCVAAAAAPAAFDATFETYYADTAKPLDAVGVSNIVGATDGNAGPARARAASGKRAWADLLAGLERDAAV